MLALCSLASANATKLYATYGTPASSGSWDAETSTYSWTQSYSNLMTIFECPNGMLAEYTSLHLTTGDYNSGPYRVCFMNGNTLVTSISFYSAGQKDLVFSVRDETKDLDLSQITHISFGGASGSGSIKLVSTPYLQKPFELKFDENGEAEISVTDLTASGCFSLDGETGVLTSSSETNWGQLKVNLPTEGVDLSAVTNISFNYTGEDIINTLEITDAVNGKLNTWYSSKYNCNFTDYASKATAVTSIMWSAPYQDTKDASMTITSIKLKANVIVAARAGETSLETLQYHNFPDGSNTTAAWNVGKSTDTYYGSGSSNANYYVDLTGYEELRIYRDDQTAFRAFFINAGGTGTNNITNTSDATSWNADGKYFSIDLSKVEKYEEKVYLNTIKSASYGTNNVVNNITVYKAPEIGDPQYTLTGSGVLAASAKAALADETAMLIDATGVTGSGLTLTTANPNCLIRANAGVLANPQNVIVDGTVASLALTDGYPFAAPATAATATTAAYSRAMSNQYGTICLPFAVASTEAVKYYSLGAIDGDVLTITELTTLAAGAPAIVEKVSGDGIEATGNGALTAPADAEGALTFIGTYEPAVVKAADYAGAIYAISNNQFVKANNSITLAPFRAFFTAAGTSEAKLRISVDDAATAIEQLTDKDAIITGIFGADGTVRGSLRKGLNIIKKSNGQTLKVMVK